MLGIESQLELLLQIIFAACLGGIIGFEREFDGHSAGFRTHIFIAATAASLILLGGAVTSQYALLDASRLQSDPLRIIEAIIVGISFIGAGVIIKDHHGEKVRNLTTAASILFTAIIGISVGISYYVLALGLTILALIVNYTLLKVQMRLHPLA